MSKRVETTLQLFPKEKEILLKHFPQGVCAFDLEMTGLSALFDKIIEIAAIKLLPSGEVEYFHSLINPLIEIPAKTIPYHGLNNEDLRDAPTLKKPLREFSKFFGNLPLIAHNAIFDTSFLILGMHQFNIAPSLSDVYDSCKLARAVYKKEDVKPQSFKLDDLAKFYQFEFTHHLALDDAVMALKIMAQGLIKKENEKFHLKSTAFTYKLSSFQKPTEYILKQKFKEMKEWIHGQTPFEIKYKGGSYKNEYRPIKPISLLALPQGIVLYALCLNSNYNKYFQLRKIQSIKKPEID